MPEIEDLLRSAQISRVDHLPIVAAFCRRIGVLEAVNRVVPTQMQVDVGTTCEALVLDTLSGRSPLYRLAAFFEHQQTEPLLGRVRPDLLFRRNPFSRKPCRPVAPPVPARGH